MANPIDTDPFLAVCASLLSVEEPADKYNRFLAILRRRVGDKKGFLTLLGYYRNLLDTCQGKGLSLGELDASIFRRMKLIHEREPFTDEEREELLQRLPSSILRLRIERYEYL